MAEFTWKLVVTVIISVFGSSFQFYHAGIFNNLQTVMEDWIMMSYADRKILLSPSGCMFILSTTMSALKFGAMCGTIYSSWFVDTIGRRNGLIVLGILSTIAILLCAAVKSCLTFLLSITVSSLNFGAMLGTLYSSWYVDFFGRRNGLIIVGSGNIVAMAVCVIAKFVRLPELLIFGRLIIGLNLGCACVVLPIYLNEISPVKYRGAFGTANVIFAALGDFSSRIFGLPAVLGTADLWYLAVAVPAIPSMLMAIGLLFCAKSPRFLYMMKDDEAGARKSIEFFLGEENTDQAMAEVKHAVEMSKAYTKQQEKTGHTFTKLIRDREFRKPLVISVLVMVAEQFTGGYAIFPFSTKIFEGVGLGSSAAQYSTTALGAAYFFSTLLSIRLIEKAGRKPLFLFQLIGCLLCVVGFTVTRIVATQVVGYDLELGYVAIGVMIVFMIVFGIGAPVPWMVSSELFMMAHRSIGVSVTTFVAGGLSCFIATFFLSFQLAVGQSLAFTPFIVVLGISLVLLFIYLPETKAKTIEDIITDYQQHHVTREIAEKLKHKIDDHFHHEDHHQVSPASLSEMDVEALAPKENGKTII